MRHYFECKLDDKNRLTIPAELRGEFAGRVIITRGFKPGQLHMYGQQVWEDKMESALEGTWKKEGDTPAILDEELAEKSDRLLEGMMETTMDGKQGRVTIEQRLLRHAGFDRTKEVAAIKRPGGYWVLKTPSN